MADTTNGFNDEDTIITEAKGASAGDFSKFEGLALGDEDETVEAKVEAEDKSEAEDKAEDEVETEDTDGEEDDTEADEQEEDESGDGDDAEEEDEAAAEVEEDAEEEPVKKKGKRSVQQRIAALTKRAHEADRATKAANERLEASEARTKELETLQEAKEAPAPDPTADKYRYGEVDEQYIKDLADHTVNKRMADLKIEENVKAETAQAEERKSYFTTKKDDMVRSGIEQYDDFEDSLEAIESGEVPLTFVMAELILESKHGAEMTNALANDPAEATRISQLPELRQAAAIGKLEGKFTSSAKSSAKKGRKSTSAPDPIRHKAKGKGGKFQASQASSDFASFEKMANARS